MHPIRITKIVLCWSPSNSKSEKFGTSPFMENVFFLVCELFPPFHSSPSSSSFFDRLFSQTFSRLYPNARSDSFIHANRRTLERLCFIVKRRKTVSVFSASAFLIRRLRFMQVLTCEGNTQSLFCQENVKILSVPLSTYLTRVLLRILKRRLSTWLDK